MRVTTITENVTQLTKLGIVNCYLVREKDSLTLVDAALRKCHKAIADAAKSIGLPIARIVLTHAHEDHVGAVDALMQLFPVAELAASVRSLPFLCQPPDKSLLLGENRGPREDRIKGPLPGIASVPTRIVTDGDSYGSLRVIDTPGHIPGHIALLDERDGTLFAGDALMAMGRLAVCTDSPWYFPQKRFTWSAPLAIESAERLLDYPVKRFACGHGKVRDGGHAALHKALAAARLN